MRLSRLRQAAEGPDLCQPIGNEHPTSPDSLITMYDQSAVAQSLENLWRRLKTEKKKKSGNGAALRFALPEAERTSEQQNKSDHTQSGFTDCKECGGR